MTLVGRRIKLNSYSLLTELGTLWRPGIKFGTVVSVTPNKFFQNQESVSWLRIKLDKARGKYKYAQAYYDQKKNRLMLGASWVK